MMKSIASGGYAGGGGAFPSWIALRRKEARLAWEQLPWPTRRSPLWKNSPVELFNVGEYHPAGTELGEKDRNDAGAPAAKVGTELEDDAFAAVLRFVDGEPDWGTKSPRGVAGLSVNSGEGAIPESADRFFGPETLEDKLRARLWSESSPILSISIGDVYTAKKSILLDWIDDREGVYVAPLVFISVEEGASARFVIRWRSSRWDAARGIFLSPALCVDLKRNARLNLFELVEMSRASRFLDYPEVILGEGTELEWTRGLFGGAVVKSRMTARLEGKAARLNVTGAYAATSGQHVEESVVQHHSGELTWSRSRFDSVADGDGRAISHGLIKVDKGAVGSDAYLSSRTLSLSPMARAVSLPELAIDTNELSASHGSTVGTIGPEELFYMQSRGLAPEQAKALVAAGVLGNILEKTPEELSSLVEAHIDRALEGRNISSAEEEHRD